MDKLEALAHAYKAVTEMSSKEKMKRGLYNSKLDPVGQEDGDVDNDGDKDKSDKYLLRRRKAITKAIKKSGEDDPSKENGETAVMNPKEGVVKTADRKPEVYMAPDGKKRTRMVPVDKQVVGTGESVDMSIREKLLSVIENRGEHYKSAAAAEPMDNNLKGEGAKKMKADLGAMTPVIDAQKVADDDVKAIEKSAKEAPKNSTDKNAKGDKKIINAPEDITSKGVKTESFAAMVKSVGTAYQSMYEKTVNEDYGITQDAKRHAEKDGKNYDGDVSVQHEYDAYHYKKNGYTHFEPGSYGSRRYTKGPTAHMSSTAIQPKHYSGVSQ